MAAMKVTALALVFSLQLAGAGLIHAQTILPLWPHGTPQPPQTTQPEMDVTTDQDAFINGHRTARLTNVTEPTMTVFLPQHSTGVMSAALVFPSGGKRLQSGMIHVGVTYCTTTTKLAVASEAQSHALRPARSKTQSTTARSPPPRTADSAAPFATSAQKVRGVVVLNPKRASMTNVDHQRKGRRRSAAPSPSAPRYARPLGIGPQPRARTTRSSAPKPPANQNARSAASPTVAGTK